MVAASILTLFLIRHVRLRVLKVVSTGRETKRVLQNQMNEKPMKPITLRRDGKGPLKFNGQRIGDATRNSREEQEDGEMKSFVTSARLFKTGGGKYVLGVEVYNQTDECYDSRFGWVSDSLDGLYQEFKSTLLTGYLNHDLLGEVFEDTELAQQFVEEID